MAQLISVTAVHEAIRKVEHHHHEHHAKHRQLAENAAPTPASPPVESEPQP